MLLFFSHLFNKNKKAWYFSFFIMSKILQQEKDSAFSLKQLESDITLHIVKQEAELALRVNSAAYYGDLQQLKNLIRAGADPNKNDYDGRSPLVNFLLILYMAS